MLSLSGFGVAFGERTILDSVTLSVPSPGITVLLGPSGTGKSTLMRTLAGFNDASPSLRTWGSITCSQPGCDTHCRPALVMQNSKLLVSNILENLVCNLPARAELTRLAQIERIAPLLESVGWAHLLSRLSQKVVECSLAEQRAIAILRAAISGSPMIMIDEPTAGLKHNDASQILDLVNHLGETRGVLIVLHNLIEARRIASDIALLANGRIEEFGAADNFFREPSSESGRIFLATGSCPELSREAVPDNAEDDEMPVEEAVLAASSTATAAEIDVAAPAPPPPTAPSLQKQTPPTGQFVSQAMGPRGFLWVLPGQLAGTPWPGIVQETDYDLSALRAVGVTHLLTLTEYPFDDAVAAPYGIRSTHSPMPDMQPPTEAQAWELCHLIDALIASGEVVAVHCRAGLGRTGTVLTAYWLWRARGQLSALKALEDMRRIEPLWVQSQSQVDFLEEFAASVANRVRQSGVTTPTVGNADHSKKHILQP